MSKDVISPNLIRQLFATTLICFLAYFIISEMLPYLSGVLGAFTIYALFRNLMIKLLDRGIKAWFAATIIIIISIFIILIPISLIVLLLYSKIKKVIENAGELTAVIEEKATQVENYINIDILPDTAAQDIAVWVSENIQFFVGSTFTIFVSLTIMYFLIYFMLIHTKRLRQLFYSYIPLKDDNIARISKESADIVKSNAIGIPLVALIQGLIALIGYYIFGVPDPLFWFAITFISSMIPFVGTALGIVPVTILLLSQGNDWQAIGILIYGVVVVGSTDNIIRIIVQNKLANLHPLITLIGVIIGVPMFGFIGLIFGPLLLSLFLLLVKIYKNEYGKNKEKL